MRELVRSERSPSSTAEPASGVRGGRSPGGGSREAVALLSDVRVRVLLAIALAAAAAGVLAGFMPRGPVTTGEALIAMAATATVGLAAGVLVGRRWVLVLAPAVFVTVTELAFLKVEGPTVDGPSPSLLGVLVWVAVRAVLGLLIVVPLVVGAAWGVRLSPWPAAPARRARTAGLVGLGLLTAALLGLAVLIAMPASTAPILGPDGEPVAGSIAELTTVSIDGSDHGLLIRGVSTANPVLLHLAGGPGGTDIGAMRLDTRLEEHFVVVTWDQRGTGKSYRAIDPVETLTIETAVTDTLAVTEYLRERFDEERIVITGQSFGTLPAVLAAQRHPERYRAVVSTGQMVDIAETDRIFYDDVLADARERGDTALIARLDAMGPPPYDRLEDNLTLNDADRALFSYPEFDGRTEIPATIWAPENSRMDQLGALRGLADTFAVLYPKLQGLDLRQVVPELEVPVYVVVGEHESRGRIAPAREWFDDLRAPHKEWVVLPASGHRASFERPVEYAELLTRVRFETAR